MPSRSDVAYTVRQDGSWRSARGDRASEQKDTAATCLPPPRGVTAVVVVPEELLRTAVGQLKTALTMVAGELNRLDIRLRVDICRCLPTCNDDAGEASIQTETVQRRMLDLLAELQRLPE